MLSQEQLASGLEVLSLSAAAAATTDTSKSGEEAPLDSLLASAAETSSGGVGRPNAHQVRSWLGGGEGGRA